MKIKVENETSQAREDDEEIGRDTASPLHDQWLLDEALDETFPASDPISPSTGKRN
jgi:hypothetical protein